MRSWRAPVQPDAGPQIRAVRIPAPAGTVRRRLTSFDAGNAVLNPIPESRVNWTHGGAFAPHHFDRRRVTKTTRWVPNQTSISTFKGDILIPRLLSNRTGVPERWSIRSLGASQPEKFASLAFQRRGDASLIVVSCRKWAEKTVTAAAGDGNGEAF
jgi:hypothetical protein